MLSYYILYKSKKTLEGKKLSMADIFAGRKACESLEYSFVSSEVFLFVAEKAFSAEEKCG